MPSEISVNLSVSLDGKDKEKNNDNAITKWFKSEACRYKGINRTHKQHILVAICYNLKVALGIVMSNSKK